MNVGAHGLAADNAGHADDTPQLTDLPDDVVRIIMSHCGMRALMSLACTSTRHAALAAGLSGLPTITMTAKQHDGIQQWICRPNVAGKVHDLIARRCLFGRQPWLACLTNLQSVTLVHCRVRADVLACLPACLRRLDVHMLTQFSAGTGVAAPNRLSFKRFAALETLHITFEPNNWHMAFVRKLPASLRRLKLRGAPALAIESHMPRGLRDVWVEARVILIMCNRLPNSLQRLHLSTQATRLWLRDILPLRPAALEHLSLSCPGLSARVPNMGAMRRLRHLELRGNALSLSWASLAHAPSLETVRVHAAHWLAVTNPDAWPESRAVPDVRATIAEAAVTAFVLPRRRLPLPKDSSAAPPL
jgi:hypothetical protein